MLTARLIETIWYIALVSVWGSLLLSKRLPSALARAWIAFLTLGLWYGHQGADYAWVLQWTVYVTGILFLWAWLAMEDPALSIPRWHGSSAVLVLAFMSLLLQAPLPSLFSHMPTPFTEVARLWTQNWASLFALLSVALTGFFLLMGIAWRTYLPQKSF